MESAKVVNKILLSSVAFGVVSFGIGMLINSNQLNQLNKALTTGAIGGVASVAGALVTGSKKNIQEEQTDNSSDNRVRELKTEEISLQQSIADVTSKIQEAETNINSLQTEHNQLLGIIADSQSSKAAIRNRI